MKQPVKRLVFTKNSIEILNQFEKKMKDLRTSESIRLAHAESHDDPALLENKKSVKAGIEADLNQYESGRQEVYTNPTNETTHLSEDRTDYRIYL